MWYPHIAIEFQKYFSENYDPSVVAIKMYQRPWEFNMTEREIIDTAMGNVNVGPIVYKFVETGKIEQNRDTRQIFLNFSIKSPKFFFQTERFRKPQTTVLRK